jgi:hypothetical protein
MTEDVGRRWFDPYTPVPEPAEEDVRPASTPVFRVTLPPQRPKRRGHGVRQAQRIRGGFC